MRSYPQTEKMVYQEFALSKERPNEENIRKIWLLSITISSRLLFDKDEETHNWKEKWGTKFLMICVEKNKDEAIRIPCDSVTNASWFFQKSSDPCDLSRSDRFLQIFCIFENLNDRMKIR